MLQREARRGMGLIFNTLAKPGRLPTLMALASSAKKAQKSLETFTKTFVTQAIQSGVPKVPSPLVGEG